MPDKPSGKVGWTYLYQDERQWCCKCAFLKGNVVEKTSLVELRMKQGFPTNGFPIWYSQTNPDKTSPLKSRTVKPATYTKEFKYCIEWKIFCMPKVRTVHAWNLKTTDFPTVWIPVYRVAIFSVRHFLQRHHHGGGEEIEQVYELFLLLSCTWSPTIWAF